MYMDETLRDFILSFCKKYKISNIDLSDLNLHTSIDLDLNIFDLDMDMFLSEFVEQFNIDYSQFNWDNYGYPSDADAVRVDWYRMFGYQRDWVKRLCRKVYTPKLRVYHLQEAIRTGKLI
jgi:hypothetical protein